MEARHFNSIMPKYNELWSAKSLGMKIFDGAGPDLVDGEKAVEIKFKLAYKNKYFDKCWRVLGHQMNYDKDYSEIYWGFGFYSLNQEVESINISHFNNIEDFVINRELYLVNWNWAKKFPKYHQEGKTEISQWDHDIIYPRMNKSFPHVTEIKEVKGGRIYFTEGVDSSRFNVESSFDE